MVNQSSVNNSSVLDQWTTVILKLKDNDELAWLYLPLTPNTLKARLSEL